jgi:hypothetical protein
MDVRFEPSTQDTELFPSEGQRLIAVYRVWSVIQLMDPFRERARAEWDQALTDFIPKVFGAKNAEEYHLLIREMVARAQDPHAVAESSIIGRILGPIPNPPIAVDTVEGKLVVTRVLEGVRDIARGDIIHAMDGRSIEQMQQQYLRYACCASEKMDIDPGLRGPENSVVELLVESRDGQRKTVTFKRTRENYRAIYPARGGDPVQFIPGNIGYVDLERTSFQEVESALEKFRNTNGLIFDLRGAARFTAWPLAARLTTRDAPAVQRQIGRYVTSPLVLLSGIIPEGLGASNTPHMDTMAVQLGRLPRTDKWRYEKPTIALINDWAMSSPELSALLLKAANNTKLVGSRTGGGCGIRMIFNLPGGIRASYTGSGRQFLDGTDCQGIGVQPDVVVVPTISGLRTGRDEVLERALLEFGVKAELHGVGTAP